MRKSLRRVAALTRKETIQLLRDRRTLAIILITPLLELLFLGYAMDLTVDHIPTAVADMAMDVQSRAFINALVVSEHFDMEMVANSEAHVIQAIDEGRVRAGVVIPPRLAARVGRGDAQVLVLLDGSDSFTVQSGYSAAVAIAQAQAMDLMVEKVSRVGAHVGAMPITSSARTLYNPDMNGMVFFVPALAAMIMQLTSLNLTTMAVVRERELGVLEQLLITPASPMELMISKMVPNIVLTVLNMLSVVLVGVFWFGVPFRGNVWLFAWLSLLFIVSGLGLGLLISTISQTQRQAQQLSSLILLLNMLLTGFMYPRAPMPPVIRAVGNLIPLTYFTRIIRGVFTKGIGLSFMWNDVLALLAYGISVMVLASATFKKRLD
jgi:ABC-2 type transport system permease protein